MKQNLILCTDSYKASHYLQYPEGTSQVFSYIESRGGRYDKTVFFGLQAYLREYLEGVVITQEMIDEADEFFKGHGEPFNREGWEYIVREHGGRLPLEIRAVREGTAVPVKNILASVTNTDPNCAWLPSYIETTILRGVWYSTTVATRSNSIRNTIKRFLETTGDLAGLDFKLHDFGARGVSSGESAALGGMAHLVNFNGTDTIEGILAAKRYYDEPMAGFSIPAAEHSTMTMLGEEGEIEQFRQMIRCFAKPGSLFAVVSDGYDIMAACDKWGALRDEIVASGAMLVVRPDSGDPVKMSLDVIRRLERHYGSTVNDKGFKVLNNVRVIYGDGINELTVESILLSLEYARYSADNIAFGMGGGLLQQLDRDTQKFAMKASAAQIDGRWVDVFKDPVSDRGKTSKRGRMSLFRNTMNGELMTLRTDQGPVAEEWADEMVVVFRDGALMNQQTFAEIRSRVR
jgi:nicotinamide phosphoribosyltransferase